jgi:hypothetical protein
MIAGDPNFHAVVAMIGEVKPLAEKLFPAVLAIRRGGIGRGFIALRVIGVHLVVLGIDAG